MTELESRHYIGLLGGGHVTFTLGPDKPERFAHIGPEHTIELPDGSRAYQVSKEIAEEWALNGIDVDRFELLGEGDTEEDEDR
jgi:hypothetical protein